MRMRMAALLVAVAACGSHSPITPDTSPPTVIPLGAQLLQIVHEPTTALCAVPGGSTTLIVTRVTVAWTGSEWTATPTNGASGNVQLHFRPSGPATGTTVIVTGTIAGTAIHQPELFQGAPPWTAQVSFPAGTPGVLTGLASAAGVLAPYAMVSGTGTGTITMTGAGLVCPGTSFSWMLAASGA